MNILYLCDEYPPCQHGGIGTVTQTLARSLVKKGHKVIVIGFYPFYRLAKSFEIDEGVLIFRYFYGSRLNLQLSKRNVSGKIINIVNQFESYVSRIKEIIVSESIEIIESPDFLEAFRYSGPMVIQFPDFKVPFIIKLHGSYSVVNENLKSKYGNERIYLKEQILLSNADGIIAVSKSVKTRTESRFGILKNITVIHNGINVSAPETKKTEPRNNVIFAGTLNENKGIFKLLEAWRVVHRRIPGASLIIYGKYSNRTLKKLKQAISHEIIGSIKIMGFTDKNNLLKAYSTAACAIFPSVAETFGMAPIEAMMTGCPTIFTSSTSGPEIIKHMQEGLLVDPESIEDIAEAIVFMLLNTEDARRIGENGLKKVKSDFDIDLISERHLEYYKSFLPGKYLE